MRKLEPSNDKSRQTTLQRAEDSEPEENAPAITLVIADDHPIVRAAIWRVLEAQPDFEPVAEAAELDATVRKVLGYKPTALVAELNLRGHPTAEAIPRIFAASPHTAIVILTADDAPASARALLRAGASGFVLKQAPEAELIDAVRAAAAGHRYLDAEVGGHVVSEPELLDDVLGSLSHRELEVLRLVALGYTNLEIANQLRLSIRTVEAHRSRLQHKIHRSSRAEVTAFARQASLVD